MRAIYALLLCFRFLTGVRFAVQTDCDEVFNYWEPLLFVWEFGSNERLRRAPLQTWEYSPKYSLRSFGYLEVHKPLLAIASSLLKRFPNFSWLLLPSWVQGPGRLFFGTRSLLALCFGLCECIFVRAVSGKFGERLGDLLGVCLVSSPGLWQTSTQLVPSSTVTALSLLTYSAVIGGFDMLAASLMSLAVISTGWPFCVILFLPLALMILKRRGIIVALFPAAFVAVIAISWMATIDFHYYGFLVMPWLRILGYNIGVWTPTPEDGRIGPDLYGTEPLSFYMKNLFLNMNILLLYSAFGGLRLLMMPSSDSSDISPVVQKRALPTPGTSKSKLLGVIALSGISWVTAMSFLSHKEERFLYPAFPCIALIAAIGIEALIFEGWRSMRFLHWLSSIFQFKSRRNRQWWFHPFMRLATGSTLIALPLILAAFRMRAVYYNLGEPVFRVWSAVSSLPPGVDPNMTVVCTGAEWHRFPGSLFLLPQQRLGIVMSGFFGQIPGRAFTSGGVTDDGLFNSANRHVPERYTPLEDCDYLVDSTDGANSDPSESANPRTSVLESSSSTSFEVVLCRELMDAKRSGILARSFGFGTPSMSRFCIWHQNASMPLGRRIRQ